jgi:hypothetical protein
MISQERRNTGKRIFICSLAFLLSLAIHAFPQGDVRVDANGNVLNNTTNFRTAGHKLEVDNIEIKAPSDAAYDATTWDGNADAPSKNAVRDKIETLVGAASSVPMSRTIFLDINGSDSTGVAGDVSKPVATLARAKVLATALTPTAANPVKIKASPGTHTITTVSLPNYVSLGGDGIDVTIFTSSINSGPNGCALVPGNSSVISDLTIKETAVSPSYSLAVGNALSQQAFTNAILNRVKIVADTDGLNVTVANSSLTISNSIIVTNWDSVLAYGANTSVTVINCQIIADAAGSSWGTSTALARGIRSSGTATVTVFGGSVTCSGSTTQNSSFNTSSNGTLYVYDSTSNASGTSASDLVREDSTGSLYYSNLTRTDGGALVAVNGTPTNLSRNVIRDNNGSDFTNLATFRANVGLAIGTNVQAYDPDLDALAALTGTNTIYYRSAPNSWSSVSIGSGLSFSSGTLAATGGASVDDTAFNSSWNGVTGTAPSKNAVYDWAHAIDPSDNGRIASTEIQDFSASAPTSSGQIPIWDAGTSKYIPGDPLVQGLTAHDAVGTSTNPVAGGGFASAAAPSDVSADGDIVRQWHLRNGSQVVNVAAGGSLIGATSNALDVNIKSGNPTSITANAGTNLNTSALALDATLTGGTQRSKLTDGSNNVGVASSSTASDESAVDRLKVNAALRLLDTAQSAGAQLVAAKGDQSTGLWVNVKNSLSVAESGTWNMRLQDTSGNGLTSNSSTYTAKFALDGNLLGTLGTAFSTPGKIDIKEAAGDNVTLGNTTDAAAADANGTVNAHVRETAKDAASIVANGVKLTNGTQAADTAAGDTGQNSLVTSGARKEVTFTTTTAQAVASTDVSNYRWVEVQITSAGGSAVHTFQVSNDNSTWLAYPLSTNGGSSFASFTTNPGSAGLYYGPINARYFRINVTGIASGTSAGTIEFTSSPSAIHNFPVKLLGDSGNSVFQNVTASTAASQGITALGVYNSTELSPTNGQSTALQIDSKGRLKMTLRDAANNDRGVNVTAENALNSTQTPTTSGGLSIYRLLSAATTNGNNIKASAGQIYGWYLYNTAASVKFVKLYNKASAPTVGTDTPVMTIPLPATSGANVFTDSGIAFGTGISVAITGAVGDADTTAVAANDVIVNFLYK